MKLKISIFTLVLLVLIVVSIFIYNDNYTLLKIQLPLLNLCGYFSGTFGASYIFDKIIRKAIDNNQQNINPYRLLIQLNPYINLFLFGFFGIISLTSIIILILFA